MGIDIGTSGCKCCVTDRTGAVVCTHSTEYTYLSDGQGKAEQDPDTWYQALIHTLDEIRDVYHIDLTQIMAVGVTGQMRGLTCIGRDGEVARNTILWNDTRCYKQVNAILQGGYEKIKRITFNPINTMCTLPKLLWLKQNEPGMYQKTASFIFPKDFINYRLTGVLSTDHTDASATLLYDMKAGTWSEDILDKYGIDRKKLPVIHHSFDSIGNLTAKAARQTGLTEGVPVIAGGSDATVELYAAGITDDTRCKIRLGSSCGISIVIDPGDWAEDMKHYCWKHVDGKHIVLDINTRSCATSVKWLRDVFYSECPKEGETFQRMDTDAAGIVLGSEGLIFHPYLQGEDAPYWAPGLRGMFTGIGVHHRRGHFARAVYEGIAYSIKDVIETYKQAYQNCNEYVLLGGGTKAPAWVGVLLDVLGEDASIPLKADAAYGACLMAAKNCCPDFSLGVQDDQKRKYNPKNHRIYNKGFDTYKSLINLMKLNQLAEAVKDLGTISLW